MANTKTDLLLNPKILFDSIAEAAHPQEPSALSLLLNSTSPATAEPSPQNIHASVNKFILPFSSIAGRMVEALDRNQNSLLQLEKSRREAIALYLEQLSTIDSEPITGALGRPGGQVDLKNWIQGLDGGMNSARLQALKIFFEETALFYLAQALILKNWSLLGVCKLTTSDLGRMNWVLSTTLRPFVPVGKENWLVTKNLYSWYIPSDSIQNEVWDIISPLNRDEAQSLLISLNQIICHSQKNVPETQGFDSKFLDALSSTTRLLGFEPQSRVQYGFSPTLRSGSVCRSFAKNLQWMGTETHPVLILMAEFEQLWNGPKPPHPWLVGNGLDCLTKEQLDWVSRSMNATTQQRLSEFSASDISVVFEERKVATQKYRVGIDQYPLFKKIRAKTTSIGELQACVAMSKLRPGGIFWWIREAPLSAETGTEVLRYLFERGRLVAEWDLSRLKHTLPANQTLFSKYIYLFEREPEAVKRISHHPLRIIVDGQIRSHLEIPRAFEEIFHAVIREPDSKSAWKTHRIVSPSAQKDWIERWPAAEDLQNYQKLEELKRNSVPLAELVTVRAIKKGQLPKMGPGLLLQIHSDGSIRVTSDPKEDASSDGFFVFSQNKKMLSILEAYLKSEWPARWLKYQGPISEGAIRLIPVPKFLLNFEEPNTFMELCDELFQLRTQSESLFSMVDPKGSIRWSLFFQITPPSELQSCVLHPSLNISGQMPPQISISKIEKVSAPSEGILFLTDSGHHAMVQSDQPLLLEMIFDQTQQLKHPTWNELTQTVRLPRNLENTQAMAHEILRKYGSVLQQMKALEKRISDCPIF